jgi:hypothetical protein
MNQRPAHLGTNIDRVVGTHVAISSCKMAMPQHETRRGPNRLHKVFDLLRAANHLRLQASAARLKDLYIPHHTLRFAAGTESLRLAIPTTSGPESRSNLSQNHEKPYVTQNSLRNSQATSLHPINLKPTFTTTSLEL